MTIDEHATSFAGLPVELFAPGSAIRPDRAYRVAYDEDEETPWAELFEALLDADGADGLRALVVGAWEEAFGGESSASAVEALVAARGRLPRLEAIFLGDLVSEESEISWIRQCDVSPIFSAYPGLTHFRVRGGTDLELGTVRHAKLRSLVVESGGLPGSVVRSVTSAELPALEHLELWLGTSEYGASWSTTDLDPLFAGGVFPALRSLALRNCELADALAKRLADAAITGRLHTLDLSLGTLSDDGGLALAGSSAVKALRKLDLHRHYLSDEVAAKLAALGPEVDVSEPTEPDRWDGAEHRYVAVGE